MPLREQVENNGICNRDDDDNAKKQVAKESHCTFPVHLFTSFLSVILACVLNYC